MDSMVASLGYSASSAIADPAAKRALALLIPVAAPVSMIGAFAASKAAFGPIPGYLVGFLVYWCVWCLAVPVFLLGPSRVRELFADRHPRLGRPWLIGLLALLFPAVGALATRWFPEVGGAGVAMVGGALVIGVVNATMEELLWRGVFVSYWPSDWRLGLLWPTIGFGAWHLAPQVIRPAAMGPLPYGASAALLGLCWGWVAFRTGSLRWTWLSHVVTDSSGIRNLAFFLPIR
jgi:membrane protease YdiL (CAAX protease family)